MKKPTRGSKVRVTVRRPEYYIYSKEEYRDTTYTGVVIRDEPWFRDHQFGIDCGREDRMPYRVIDISNVIDLQLDVDKSSNGEDTDKVSFRKPNRNGGNFMSTLKSSNLGWGERFAIIHNYDLTDTQATETFGVSADELNTARELLDAGTISVATDVDFSQFEGELGVRRPETKPAAPTPVVKPEKPVTATKPKGEPKKRGRKGDKIITAFRSVPTEPTDAEAFAAQYGVSIAVLRQNKRFDKTDLGGLVKVRKDKELGKLMIWRDLSVS